MLVASDRQYVNDVEHRSQQKVYAVPQSRSEICQENNNFRQNIRKENMDFRQEIREENMNFRSDIKIENMKLNDRITKSNLLIGGATAVLGAAFIYDKTQNRQVKRDEMKEKLVDSK